MARAAEVLGVSVEYLAGVTASGDVRDLPGIRWVEVRGLAAAAGDGATVLAEEIEGYLGLPSGVASEPRNRSDAVRGD